MGTTVAPVVGIGVLPGVDGAGREAVQRILLSHEDLLAPSFGPLVVH